MPLKRFDMVLITWLWFKLGKNVMTSGTISLVLLGAGPCNFALWNACSIKKLGYL